MTGHDIIVIGASAGGVEALKSIVISLTEPMPASLFAVIHTEARSSGRLDNILNRNGDIRASYPEDGDKIEQGCIYLAPPDRHLLLSNEGIRIVQGPKQNRFRPAIDPLFQSAAHFYGTRVIGVVLTGYLDDGTAGLAHVRRCGGQAVVQDPEDAAYPDMPESAIAGAGADYILPLQEIPSMLMHLVKQPLTPDESKNPNNPDETFKHMWEDLTGREEGRTPAGTPSGLMCPDCGGSLWEFKDGELPRYRCRIGHVFSPRTLAAEKSEEVEAALWAAVRTLEENASFSRRLAARMLKLGHPLSAERYERRVKDAEQNAEVIRKLLMDPRRYIEWPPSEDV